jgi:hypothetical protein
MLSIDEVLSILRGMREESDMFFDNPPSTDAHGFGYARGFKHAVSEFEQRLQARIEELSKGLDDE